MSEGDGVTVPTDPAMTEPDVNQMEVAPPVSSPPLTTSANLTSLLCAAEATIREPASSDPVTRCLQLSELTKQLKRLKEIKYKNFEEKFNNGSNSSKCVIDSSNIMNDSSSIIKDNSINVESVNEFSGTVAVDNSALNDVPNDKAKVNATHNNSHNKYAKLAQLPVEREVPPAPPKIQPLMVQNNNKYRETLKKLNDKFGNVKASLANEYIKVYPETAERHREMQKFCRENKINFYVIRPPSERPFKIVIKGVHPDTETNEIKKELEIAVSEIEIIKIISMKNIRSKKPMPMYMVELKKNGKEEKNFRPLEIYVLYSNSRKLQKTPRRNAMLEL
ncbi:hypothetical protein AVEN_154444-1 [Araneus ventricosus]|uniref:Pre-C2HC domain-containing protein n=1 Tax=Araneus ventricosus TaxID=182803 RepID=A0A4Y2JV52_ARAVE|nr:hypothetical protein AVEN_154444-1 [Araneus ventricosus]